MNANHKKLSAEKISAYIDDALNADEIDTLIAENENSERPGSNFSVATRYCMLGEALRGELSDASMVDVSAQVREALRSEPLMTVEAAKPVQIHSDSRFDFFGWLGSLAMPLAGAAVAASVAVVMVLTVVQNDSSMSGPKLASQPVNSPATVSDTMVANQGANDKSTNKQQIADFDTYLTEHAEFAAQDTIQGRLPYVRAVSYESE